MQGASASRYVKSCLANPRNSHGCMHGLLFTRCHDLSHCINLCMLGSAAANMLSVGTLLAKNVVSSARRRENKLSDSELEILVIKHIAVFHHSFKTGKVIRTGPAETRLKNAARHKMDIAFVTDSRF